MDACVQATMTPLAAGRPVRPGRIVLPRSTLTALLADLRVNRAVRVEAAARDFIGITTGLAQAGGNAVSAALAGAGRAEAWQHYPLEGRPDPEREPGYYYHCHESGARHPAEHGHFHLFMPVPTARRGAARGYVHLAAIAVDGHGLPVRLFTTNRWVTDETWLPAPRVQRLAHRFRLAGSDPLQRWINAVAGAFRPQLDLLLARRDARLQELSARRPLRAVLEDRRIETLSDCRISIHQQVAALEAADIRSK